jgi:hypothetical protein
LARGFRLGSGVTRLLVPIAVVGAVGFLTWYLTINPSTRVIDLFGFLAPPPLAPPGPGRSRMEQGIPVDNTGTGAGVGPNANTDINIRATGEFGSGYQPFAGAVEEDVGPYEEDYEKVSLSS